MQKCLRYAFCLSLLVLGGCLRPRGDVIDRLIIGEVMMHSEFKENLRALALPGGRLSGSENARQAERHVADALRRYGYRDVRLEPFSMPGWRVNSTEATLLTDPPVKLENAVALCQTLSTPAEGVTGDVVAVGKGTKEEFDAAGEQLRGKFALILDPNAGRRGPMALARERGALGVLYMGRPDREPIIGGCHAEPRPEPAIVIRHDDAKKIAEMLDAGQTARVNVKVQADVWDAIPNNVIAEFPGSGPLAHEQVLLCAHLDSWHLGEGAIDNGNGSTTILETARALHAVGWKPRRTVRFIWFMGEEQELRGSKAYVAAHQDELNDIVAVINVDMPGVPQQFITFEHPEIVDFLKAVGADLKAYEFKEDVPLASGDWSDHAPFMHEGVCSMTLRGDLGEGVKHYHTINDKYEAVDRPGTVQSSAVFGVLIRRLADCPERPSVRNKPD